MVDGELGGDGAGVEVGGEDVVVVDEASDGSSSVGAVVAPKPFIDPAKEQPKADVAALAGEAAAGG
ncbi:hypothetical protein ABZ546_15845 [Brachybacterium paraconglomeratum]